MFDRLTTIARAVVASAQDEARALGAPTIEAEHLLLAISATDGEAAAVLTGSGLDHGRLVELLNEERRRTLSTVGISAPTAPAPAGRTQRSLRLATSAKTLLERAVREAARSRTGAIDESQLLLAALQAEAGTVPRILALARVDPASLVGRLRERPAA